MKRGFLALALVLAAIVCLALVVMSVRASASPDTIKTGSPSALAVVGVDQIFTDVDLDSTAPLSGTFHEQVLLCFDDTCEPATHENRQWEPSANLSHNGFNDLMDSEYLTQPYVATRRLDASLKADTMGPIHRWIKC